MNIESHHSGPQAARGRVLLPETTDEPSEALARTPAASLTAEIALTKKGQAYCARHVPAENMRADVARRIEAHLAAAEALIAALDTADGDSDLEPWLGSGNVHLDGSRATYSRAGNQANWANGGLDDREVSEGDDEPDLAGSGSDLEEENEHGGDILDQPHDELDEGDREPNLGWGTMGGQGPTYGAGSKPIECLPPGDPNDTDGIDHMGGVPLGFDGAGYQEGNRLLRLKGLRQIRVAPAYGDHWGAQS